MEAITREASKLLGDCKARNICKELKKLKYEDNSKLKAYNTQLKLWVNDLQTIVKAQDKEIRQLRAHVKSLEKIREVVGTLGNILNKARLFDNNVKARGEVSAAKIIPVLVSFTMKMETTLGEMRKLLSGSPAVGSSQAPPTNPKEQPQAQELFEELKDCLQQCQV